MVSAGRWFFAAMLSGVLLLGGCSDSTTAPDVNSTTTDHPAVNFHVIAQKCDFMTGGGFVEIGRSRITFGLHAGRSKGGTVFGHLNVVDHRTGTRYQSTRISTYGKAIAPFFVSIPGTGVTRVFEGQLKVNGGVTRSFTAYMNDSGEPGRNDRIYFKVNGVGIIAGPLSGGLPTMVKLDGGNLQFHDHCIPGNPQAQ
jgi:hypothetical protein